MWREKRRQPDTLRDLKGGKRQRACIQQSRALLREARGGGVQRSWRRQLVQRQSREARVAAARLSRHFKALDVPFPHLRTDASLPLLRLPHDGWLDLQPLSDADLSLLEAGAPLPRRPFPTDAVVDHVVCRVRMPIEWNITLPPSAFILPDGASVTSTYSLADVRASTTMEALAADVKQWLLSHSTCGAVSLHDIPLQLHIINTEHDGVTTLPPHQTARDADLYNDRARLIATALPRAPGMNDLAQQRLRAQQAAYNNRPDAPEHTGMLNNLLAERRAGPHEHANLPLSSREYRQLDSHLLAITRKPINVCFNCCYMMYPKPANRIRVKKTAHLQSKQDARGYRVAHHFIDAYVARHNVAEDDVFLCVDCDNDTLEVYACAACRRESRQQPTFDLFDGVASDNSFISAGLGDPEPPQLACLNAHERLSLSVLKMCDATFLAYAGFGYLHYSGGGMLQPADFSGLAALLVGNPEADSISESRVRAALTLLISEADGNPLVHNLLTCLERELDAPQADDLFPQAAGRGGLPMLDEAAAGADLHATNAAVAPPQLARQQAARVLQAQPFTGALQTVDEVDPSAALAGNRLEHQVVGTTRARDSGTARAHAALSTSERSAVDAALHTTLYRTGRGAHYEHESACSHEQYRKVRLGGIVPKFRRAEEFLWSQFQTMVKKQFHAGGPRLVGDDVTAAATRSTVAAQTAELQRQRARRVEQRPDVQQYQLASDDTAAAPNVQHAMDHCRQANPAVVQNITTAESLSGGVAKTVVGSKRYWHNAFIELMAMACEYGVPQFFVTFTANENGWADVHAATEGRFYARCPVETTRQYHHRWTQFKGTFLKGDSPIGNITHTWHRQEDQARASLHVHMAIWVEGTPNPDAICVTAPRGGDLTAPAAGLTAAQLEWRRFVLSVQRHDCTSKCDGQGPGGKCKYLYPHDIWTEAELAERDDQGNAIYYRLNSETDRYEYRTLLSEDQRLSPYIPLWLLATGASMNIQYCTSIGFLAYIAKYCAKTEPHGMVSDTCELRQRDNVASPQMRFLDARIVGAPEVVFRLFEFEMKHGVSVTHLTTKPPGSRKRALSRILGRDDPGEQSPWREANVSPPRCSLPSSHRSSLPLSGTDVLRFFDGTIEQYARRPHDQHGPDNNIINFDTMLYPTFHREYEVVTFENISKTQWEADVCWRCLLLPNEAPLPHDDADHPHPKSKWTVRRLSPRPVWWDW